MGVQTNSQRLTRGIRIGNDQHGRAQYALNSGRYVPHRSPNHARCYGPRTGPPAGNGGGAARSGKQPADDDLVGPRQAFNSFLSSFKNRQSAPWAISFPAKPWAKAGCAGPSSTTNRVENSAQSGFKLPLPFAGLSGGIPGIPLYCAKSVNSIFVAKTQSTAPSTRFRVGTGMRCAIRAPTGTVTNVPITTAASAGRKT